MKDSEKKRIEIYTEKEIDSLIRYYSDKIIGKNFGENYPYKIEKFEATKIKVKYQLQCVGFLLRQSSTIIKIDISTLCKENSLLSPLEVLKDQS
ncbi:hypothetical protein [Meridianimaribacter flavus]|uniref:Uncharacterized protein n=1 Tax=Meridianimaribacter flavus TaxID=571115 RepID=A0ABY2G1C1_9FLAO|nr:hypothetical protein [Meridianimaribacter flavus]TDY05768.1 hypothetical protein A8975_2858 [Meridianimaribacter flavus]